MTTRLYYTSRNLSGSAIITAATCEKGQTLVELDHTLFAPKGGGQQSDLGTINGRTVVDVRYHGENSIVHVLPEDAVHGLNIGQQVNLVVDAQRRELNSRLHTAGHLVAQAAEQVVLGSTAAQGHHWPGESRVELIVDQIDDIEIAQQRIVEMVNALIKEDRAVHCTDDSVGRRKVTIIGFTPIECGGTHIASLAALGMVELRGIKWKKGRLRIGYDC